MKSIVTILRVKQREIDALKRTQAQMENHREMMHQALQQLADALVSELKTAEAMPEMAQFFGDFSAHIKRRQEDIHGQMRKLEFEMNKLAERIREQFSEMKKYELALKAFEKREADKARARAQQEMDDIAIQGYVRKHAH